jgi:ribosomal protein S18 acetylase RimI-like enzyme
MRTTEPSEPEEPRIWLATPADAAVFARLLHAFNLEFGASTPSAKVIASRAEPLIAAGQITVLLVGGGPDGFAELRFRTSLYTGALDAYLEELYVVPECRGRGLGQALLDAAMDKARQRGATHIDLNTSVDDTAARALYETAGFTNREGGSEGSQMLYYERDL